MVEFLSWMFGVVSGMAIMLVLIRIKSDIREELVKRKLKKDMDEE
jgi:hypothetical protein